MVGVTVRACTVPVALRFAVAGACPASATCVENAIFLPASHGYEDILKVDATSIIDGAGLLNLASVTGTLGEVSGGTGQTTYAAGDILYASGVNTLAKLPKGSDGEVLIHQDPPGVVVEYVFA